MKQDARPPTPSGDDRDSRDDQALDDAAPRRRRWPHVLVVILLLAAAGLAAAWIRIDRLDRDALHLAETGKSTIQLLNDLRDAMAGGSAEELAALYGPTAVADDPAAWTVSDRELRDGIAVLRWQGDAPEERAASEVAEGWLGWLGSPDEVDLFKIKLGRILSFDDDGAGAEVRAFLWRREHHPEEVAASRRESRLWLRLRVGPIAGDPDGAWRVHEQELLSGETVEGSGTAFTDVAVEAGIDLEPRHNPRFATDEWFPHRFGIIRYGSAGVAAADYDGDGWDDVYFADGERPRLYRNLGDGTFRDVTEEAGLPDDLEGTNVALLVDLDSDGDRDLFLGVFTGPNRLFRNDGDGTFTDVTEGAGLGGEFSVVATAGDVDGDGRVDLYVGRYLDPRKDLPTTLFYTRNGAPNRLLRNLGDLRFEDVTEATGTGDTGLSLGVTFADYDRDGDQDLYVANDFGRNTLYRNDGPGEDGHVTFTDVSARNGSDAIDFGYGMSATWADFDNDRDFDMYVSNVHSGQRWYSQAATVSKYLLNSVRQGTIREDFPIYREIFDFVGSDWHAHGDRMTKGNSLLRNDGDRFVDVAEAAGANPFGWYWGAAALDFDHDGRLDLYGGNGWISGRTYDDL